MKDDLAPARPYVYAGFLVLAGVLGWFFAFQLTLDKFAVLTDPDAQLSCNISVVVSCGKNLASWQGALFGFPNPLIGLAAWVAPVVVGLALLAGAKFDRWFRIAFNVGVLGAIALVVFLVYTSIFVLGTLCIWCMLTWVVTIPLFWLVTLNNLRDGTIPVAPRAREFFARLYEWVPALTIACYLIIGVLAQVRLDALNSL